MKKVEMIVERTRTGYSAYADNIPRDFVGTTGVDMSELKKNILEALNLYYDYKTSGKKKKVTLKDIKITLDIAQFFEYYKIINAKALSERIGMNQSLMAQYIHGIKKPSAAQTKRILDGIHKVGKELVAIQFK